MYMLYVVEKPAKYQFTPCNRQAVYRLLSVKMQIRLATTAYANEIEAISRLDCLLIYLQNNNLKYIPINTLCTYLLLS